jgi:hypothetical protein
MACLLGEIGAIQLVHAHSSFQLQKEALFIRDNTPPHVDWRVFVFLFWFKKEDSYTWRKLD